jgi:hypothetical protein
MKVLIRGSWTSCFFETAIYWCKSAQLIFNRTVRYCLPTHRRSLAPEWQKAADVLEKRARRSKELKIAHYNKHTKPLALLVVGNHVLIQHPISKLWCTPGVIVEVAHYRDYLINTSAGWIFLRNRRFLRLRVPVFPTPSTTPATTPAQPEAVQPPPPKPANSPVQENPVPPVQENPVPPVVRRSTRRRQPQGHFFSAEWTQ